MAVTKFVKPADGLKVRHEDPRRGHVLAEGEDVVLTSFYRRRIADGDLVVTKRLPVPKPEKGEKS